MIWLLIKTYWRPLAIAGVLLAVAAAIGWYGHTRYQHGQADARAEIAAQTRVIETAMQEGRDRADANYRGAVLAREAAQKDTAAVRDRLDRLLRQHRSDAKDTGPSGGPDGSSPDWIGVVGACYAEYGDLGADAAGWADQVNGLQGYVRAIRRRAVP